MLLPKSTRYLSLIILIIHALLSSTSGVSFYAGKYTTYKLPMLNINIKFNFFLIFIFNIPSSGIGSIRITKSCAMLSPLLEKAMTLRLRHVLWMVRSYTPRIGEHWKIKITVKAMPTATTEARVIRALIRKARLGNTLR